MYAKFGEQWMCMHRGPTWEYEEESLDHSSHLQRNVDAGTLINQDQTDSVSTMHCQLCIWFDCTESGRLLKSTARSRYGYSFPSYGLDQNSREILMTCQSLLHVNQVQLFLNHHVYCGLLTKAEEWHWSSYGEEQTRTRLKVS